MFFFSSNCLFLLLLCILFLLSYQIQQSSFTIKDFTFDTDDEYISSYENFNIYYHEIRQRENNNKESIWESSESEIDQYRKIKQKEDEYLQKEKVTEDSNNLYDEYGYHFKNKFRTKTDQIDDIEVFNPEIHDEMYHHSTLYRNKRIAEGHPGMNLDSIISNRHFGLNKEKKNNFNQFINNNNSNQSWLSYINFSFFGFSLSEYFLVTMVIIFAYFYLFSTTFNDKWATVWYDANKNYFDRFARICVKPEVEEIKNKTQLIKDSYNVYRYYAEEFKNIKWFTAILEFRKNQDSSSVLSGLFFTITDKVYYRVALNPVEPVPNVFVICKKKDLKNVKAAYKDVEFFTNYYQPSNFNENLVEMAENELSGDMFRNKELLHYFKLIENYIDMIYYTDQQTFTKE